MINIYVQSDHNTLNHGDGLTVSQKYLMTR